MRLRGTQWPGYERLASALGQFGRIEHVNEVMEGLRGVESLASLSVVKEYHPITDADCMD